MPDKRAQTTMNMIKRFVTGLSMKFKMYGIHSKIAQHTKPRKCDQLSRKRQSVMSHMLKESDKDIKAISRTMLHEVKVNTLKMNGKIEFLRWKP